MGPALPDPNSRPSLHNIRLSTTHTLYYTSIPNNHEGQGITEKTHQTLKAHLKNKETKTNKHKNQSSTPLTRQLTVAMGTLKILYTYKKLAKTRTPIFV